VRKQLNELEDAQADDDLVGRRRWPVALLGLMLRRPQDTLAALVASTALVTILVNALFLQPDPHPAPIFSVRPKQAATGRDSTGAIALPRPRPPEAPMRAEPAQRTPGARSRNEGEAIPTPVARPLGAAKGNALQSAPTNAAVRGDPAAPTRHDPIGELAARGDHGSVRPAPIPVRSEPVAPPSQIDTGGAPGIAPSRQIKALQQALTEFAFGQVKPTGVVDPATRAAIEAFESDRNMPVTGQISDRLLREVALLTGRTIE
jgi:hypothetical protein